MSDNGGRRSTLLKAGKYVGAGLGGLLVLFVVLFVLGIIGLPDGGIEDNRWGEVEDDSVEVITEIGIDNPNPFGFGGEADAEYEIDLQEVPIAEGEGTGITVDSGHNSANFSTDLATEQLPAWWSAHLNNDEVSALAADATVDVSLGPLSGSHDTTIEDEVATDIEGALDESSSAFEGSYPAVVPLFEIEDVTTEWGEVTEEVTEIQTTFEFHNPNEGTVIVLPGSGFAGEATFNEIHMLDWQTDEVTVIDEDGETSVGEDVIVEGGETEERTFVVEMDNQNIAEWFPTHVDRGEFTEIRWGTELAVQVVESDEGIVDGPLDDLPIDDLPAEFTIPPGDQMLDCDIDLQTGIFEDQDTDVSFDGCVTPTVEESDIGSLTGDGGLLSG